MRLTPVPAVDTGCPMFYRTVVPRLTALSLLAALAGCVGSRDPFARLPTPAEAGLNGRDLIDPPAQREADALFNVSSLVMAGDDVRRMAADRADRADPNRKGRPPKNVLCLSGGGSYGAFSAGVLGGWTASGTRRWRTLAARTGRRRSPGRSPAGSSASGAAGG